MAQENGEGEPQGCYHLSALRSHCTTKGSQRLEENLKTTAGEPWDWLRGNLGTSRQPRKGGGLVQHLAPYETPCTVPLTRAVVKEKKEDNTYTMCKIR